MKKRGDGSVDTKLARFLLSYQITPQSTTGESPAHLRWGRSLRSHLDLLRPDVATRVHLAQSRQKNQHDQHSRTRGVKLGDAVSVRNYCQGVEVGPWNYHPGNRPAVCTSRTRGWNGSSETSWPINFSYYRASSPQSNSSKGRAYQRRKCCSGGCSTRCE